MPSGLRWAALLVVLATVAVFANGMRGSFVWIDHTEIVQQGFVVHSPDEFRAAWIGSVTDLDHPGASGAKTSGYYRPIQVLYVTAAVRLFGQRPLLHHIANLLLHLAATLLLLRIVWRLSASPFLAAFCALLYGIHPVHVESVTWISGSKDTLSGLFFFGALAAYLGAVQGASHRGWRYVSSLFLFAVGLLAKEVVVVLPAIVLLVELAEHTREGGTMGAFPRRALRVSGFVVVALLYLAVRRAALGSLGDLQAGTWHGNGPFQTFLTMPGVVAEYVGKLLLPLGLTTADTTRIVTSPLNLRFLGGSLVVLLLLFLVIFARRRLPLLSLGLGWFFCALLPALNIFPVQHIKAERFLYLPSAGFFLALAAVWERLGRGSAVDPTVPASGSKRRERRPDRSRSPRPSRRADRWPNRWTSQWKNRWMLAAAAVYLIVLGGITIDRNRDWKDDFTLFSHDVGRTPNYREGHAMLAFAYAERGAPGDAEIALRQADAAAREDPAYTSFVNRIGVLDSRARALIELGRFTEALDAFQAAAAMDPGEPLFPMNMGIALGYLGRIDESLAAYGRAEQLDPDLGIVYFNRALTLYTAGRPGEALHDLERGCQLLPRHTGCWNLRGKILLDAHDPVQAASCFRRSLAVYPQQPRIVQLLRQAEQGRRPAAPAR